MNDIALVQKAAGFLYNKKGRDIVALDVHELTTVCEYMLIATGRSTVQVRALCDAVEEGMQELGYAPFAIENQKEARWLVLDYGFLVVHVFHTEEREFYQLERLWKDGQNSVALAFEDLDA